MNYYYYILLGINTGLEVYFYGFRADLRIAALAFFVNTRIACDRRSVCPQYLFTSLCNLLETALAPAAASFLHVPSPGTSQEK